MDRIIHLCFQVLVIFIMRIILLKKVNHISYINRKSIVLLQMHYASRFTSNIKVQHEIGYLVLKKSMEANMWMKRLFRFQLSI